MIQLSPRQIDEIIESVKGSLLEKLYSEQREDLGLVSPAQACGMLDVSPQTLRVLEIPRVVLIPNKLIKYKISDIKKHIQENTEK